MKSNVFLFLIILVSSCTNACRHTSPGGSNEVAAKMGSAELTYTINQVPEGKYGYTIFLNGQTYIQQNTIPAIQERHGFETKADAERVAKLAIKKLKQGEMSPNISLEDLKNLGISIEQQN